ncbi:Rieske (2Fe-2S) protein [Streptomyces chiangmaiensis]|uniref:Cytochrome bc1 complex Rieske iron-sulfur subunit n=1 Tax=Streptomyces chiangmaiensis TaxID=766497 RepID=A0ABU7FFZ6_9ACTN|nr:Rieske (2Fe-2S) protein [Streptomyces chiangmaiensis]MED7822273.1 Rieske (2Fe-2S) protein [Streptomyces chiangmaiensis]
MTSEALQPSTAPGRRTVMAAVGATGLAAALTACGSSGDSSASSTTQGDSTANSSTTGGGENAAVGSDGTVLAKTADIPEGGGKVFADQGVVVTQPSAGTFKAFSSKCTHQGCAVKDIANGVIVCPCHDSHFSATDGSVQKGPATRPLTAAHITVSGDEIKLS